MYDMSGAAGGAGGGLLGALFAFLGLKARLEKIEKDLEKKLGTEAINELKNLISKIEDRLDKKTDYSATEEIKRKQDDIKGELIKKVECTACDKTFESCMLRFARVEKNLDDIATDEREMMKVVYKKD
jgi:hypothetical protein